MPDLAQFSLRNPIMGLDLVHKGTLVISRGSWQESYLTARFAKISCVRSS